MVSRRLPLSMLAVVQVNNGNGAGFSTYWFDDVPA